MAETIGVSFQDASIIINGHPDINNELCADYGALQTIRTAVQDCMKDESTHTDAINDYMLERLADLARNGKSQEVGSTLRAWEIVNGSRFRPSIFSDSI